MEKLFVVDELERDVKAAEKRAFDNPEINQIILSYKTLLPAERIADYINKKYDKEFSGSQIRHQFNRLKKLQQRTKA